MQNNEFQSIQEIPNFSDAYHALVTPSKERYPFSVAFAYPSESKDLLKLFMQISDWPVDQNVKNAGVYKIERPYGLNIKTDKKHFDIYLEEMEKAILN